MNTFATRSQCQRFLSQRCWEIQPPWCKTSWCECWWPREFSRNGGRNKHFGFSVGKAFGCGRASHSPPRSRTRKKNGDFSEYASQVSPGYLQRPPTDANANPSSSIRYMTLRWQRECSRSLPGSAATPTPFANNIIPAGGSNLTSAKLLNLWPAPNNAGASTNISYRCQHGRRPKPARLRLDHNLKNRRGFFFV